MSKRGQYKKTEPVEFLDETREAWERQPAEPEKAWRAFVLYRDALLEGGVGTRSQRAVCLSLFPNRDPTAARTRDIGLWSVRWRWVERCAAFDAKLDADKREAFRRALERDAEQGIAAYRVMRNRGSAKLLSLTSDGIAPALAVKMVETAITGLRREAGLATEIQGTEADDAFAAWLSRGAETDEEEPDADQAATDEAGRAASEGQGA